MDIIYKGTGVDLTEAIRSYAQLKINDLDKYYPGIMRIRIELGVTTTRHHKGEGLFFAEGNVHVPGHMYRAVAEARDLYAAIDDLRDELKRELSQSHKKILDKNRRAGARND